jgi:hypothetical protein
VGLKKRGKGGLKTGGKGKKGKRRKGEKPELSSAPGLPGGTFFFTVTLLGRRREME